MSWRWSSRSAAMIILAIAAVGLSATGARAYVAFASGEATGVWAADSVIVVGGIHVPPGNTLTIMPGVTVLFTSFHLFEVQNGATLHAVGTETEPIRFWGLLDGDRSQGIDFLDASDASILEYCHIRDAITTGIHLENSSITIRNCLIENCEAGTGSEGGGGIEVLSGSDALIESNEIRDNTSAFRGGGIYVGDSSPEIRGNRIASNLAGYYNSATGGGIAVYGESNPLIVDNEITSNSVHPVGSFTVNTGIGGGIYYRGGSDGLISGNTIVDNVVISGPQTKSHGGGLGIRSASPRVEFNVIASNWAQGWDGGGIHMYSCQSELVNNTIVNNRAGGLGGAIYARVATFTLVNSILYFNEDDAGTEIYLDEYTSAEVSYSDIEGSWPGEGNLDVDPALRDVPGGDSHLRSRDCGDADDSPLIDAGSPDHFDIVLDCERGLGTIACDMGAYGGGTQSATTGVGDTAELPGQRIDLSSYPNPFNPRTTIRFDLPDAKSVSLRIYDIHGRRVETLLDNERRAAGGHEVIWNASNLSSGTYFYQFDTGDRHQTGKMQLIK